MHNDLEELRSTAEAVQEAGAPFYREPYVTDVHEERDRIDYYSPALDRLIDEYRTAVSGLDDLTGFDRNADDQLVWALPDRMTETYEEEQVFALARDARDRMRIYCTFDRFLQKFARDFERAEGPQELRGSLQETAEEAQTGFDTYFRLWDDWAPGWEDVLWAWYRSNPAVDEQVAGLAEQYDRIEKTSAGIVERSDRLTSRINNFEY